jgi:hypothetical protein
MIVTYAAKIIADSSPLASVVVVLDNTAVLFTSQF